MSVEALRSAIALEEGRPTRRLDDMKAVFGAGTTPASVRAQLELRVVEAPSDRDARFLLGWFQLAAGDAYAARNEWSLLASLAPTDAAVAALRDLAERLFVESPR
jgi:predicted TPR repeat methyltransferase